MLKVCQKLSREIIPPSIEFLVMLWVSVFKLKTLKAAIGVERYVISAEYDGMSKISIPSLNTI